MVTKTGPVKGSKKKTPKPKNRWRNITIEPVAKQHMPVVDISKTPTAKKKVETRRRLEELREQREDADNF